MKSNLVFIIGMRRSGTSILRQLIMRHPRVDTIKFEPHDLMFAVGTYHINRYKNSSYHKMVLAEYKNRKSKGYYGAKIALNVGMGALGWKGLHRYFPDAKFIFIQRDIKDTYNSWIKQDKKSIRGICNFEMYKDWWLHINKTFEEFTTTKPNALIINYEKLVKNADKELENIWKLLNIPILNGANKLIRKPNNWSER